MTYRPQYTLNGLPFDPDRHAKYAAVLEALKQLPSAKEGQSRERTR